MYKYVVSVLTLMSVTAIAAPSQQVQALMNQGKWEAAGDQAAKEGDYLTAGLMMHRELECPTPDHPKGQYWDEKVATKGVAYSRSIFDGTKLSDADAIDGALNLANNLSALAVSAKGGAAINFSMVKESKSMFDRAASIGSNDALAVASSAVFHGRTFNKGGIIFGTTRDSAQKLVNKGIQLFNAAPEATREQQIRKAFAAQRLGVAMEGLNDKRLGSVFEAVIKLGSMANDAEGRCVSNLAKIHLGRPIGDF